MPADIQVYNTLTKRRDVFRPIDGQHVNLFVCGPTVYDYSHLGHAKTYTQFDFIVRYLRQRGYGVFYLQNITDIDDKIIDRARQQGREPQELAREFEAIYQEDMLALHNVSVNQYARATEHMAEIVRQIQVLLDKDMAYRTTDGIYYDLSQFPNYGKLSGRTELKEDDAVSRVDESREKRNWNDFCLWKFRKPNEPYWETELGEGRPGWHIEDTAITEKHLGAQYDVHGGSIDLIFPHHEAEIAQMEAISGKEPLVRYWLHTGFLNINAQKMSKSKGNFLTIRDTLKQYDYRVLRYFFLSAHYRTTLDFTLEGLEQAKGALRRIDEFIFNIDPDGEDQGDEAAIANVRAEIYRWLDDDFDTPRALAALFDFIRSQNIKGRSGQRTYRLFNELNTVFDFMQFEQAIAEDEILALIEEREHCRKEKNFTRSDEIRDQLQAMNIQLYDTPNGPKWRNIE